MLRQLILMRMNLKGDPSAARTLVLDVQITITGRHEDNLIPDSWSYHGECPPGA